MRFFALDLTATLKRCRVLLPLGMLAMLVVSGTAGAYHLNDPRSPNMQPLGHINEFRVLGGFFDASSDIHTDIGFWGNRAVQGSWHGFNIRDVSNPNNPTQVSYTSCIGDQGDVVVYRNLVVRAWNSPASAGPSTGPFVPGNECDGQPVPAGFEGIHVFDISNEADPQLVGSLATPCGSHTATGAPDLANNRLIIYSQPSQASCSTAPVPFADSTQFEVIEIPLTAPHTPQHIRTVDTIAACHDVSVILGRANLLTCAGGDGFRVYSIGGARGGSLDNPQLLYRVQLPLVTVGHSASYSWNGNIIIFGHEPGGGTQARCRATDPPTFKSFYFHRASDGALLGTWTLPRPQGGDENCTLHNFNTVPFVDRHVLVHGSYQAGVGVVDFTTPSAAREVAFNDPPPRPPTIFCAASAPPNCDLAGSWAAYWYNDVIWDTNIGEGLGAFRVNEPWWNRALSVPHLNPQTQEDTMDCTVSARSQLRATRRGNVTVRVRVARWNQGAPRVAVRLTGAGLNRTVRTNDNGVATAAVRPSRAGTLRIAVPNTLNMRGCATQRRVAAAPRRAVRPGVGPGLTGRPAAR